MDLVRPLPAGGQCSVIWPVLAHAPLCSSSAFAKDRPVPTKGARYAIARLMRQIAKALKMAAWTPPSAAHLYRRFVDRPTARQPYMFPWLLHYSLLLTRRRITARLEDSDLAACMVIRSGRSYHSERYQRAKRLLYCPLCEDDRHCRKRAVDALVEIPGSDRRSC